MDARNRVAHFTGDLSAREALRYLDAMRELSAAVGAHAHADAIERIYEQQSAADAPRPLLQPGRPPTAQPVVRPAGRHSGPPAPPDGHAAEGAARHRAARSKYGALYRHLTALTGPEWRTSFSEIESVLGFDLPASARRYPAWWANEKGGSGHSQKRAWQEAGWRTGNLNLAAETVVFERA